MSVTVDAGHHHHIRVRCDEEEFLDRILGAEIEHAKAALLQHPPEQDQADGMAVTADAAEGDGVSGQAEIGLLVRREAKTSAWSKRFPMPPVWMKTTELPEGIRPARASAIRPAIAFPV